MAEITSLTITYEGNNVWSYTDNTMPVGKDAGASFYDGTWIEDLVTFKTDNGGILYNNIPYDRIEYVDSIDSGNDYTPTSAKALIIFLKSIGFFDKSIGGGSGADTFTELTDTIPNYFGRALQVLRVNAGETGVESFAAVLAEYFTDLLDTPNSYTGQNNKLVAVNNTGTALVFVPQPSSTNPIPDFGMAILRKGYHWENIGGFDTIIKNLSQEIEVGDYFTGSIYVNFLVPDDGVLYIPVARYKGGDTQDISSYEFEYSAKIAFDTEPDSE